MKLKTTSRLKKHAGRNDLVGEHPLGDVGQVFFILIFLSIWISDSFIWHWSTFLSTEVPLSLRLLAGTGVAAVALQLAWYGIRDVFGTIRSQPEVLKSGVFALVRHPVYLGSILFHLSLVLVTLSLLSGLWWLVITGFYAFIARHEEKALTAFFGDRYTTYKKEVPMLVPRLGKKRKTG